jgi:2-polyprenyl-6-methoxyphenol hydroxylase-like FAD-dependent oxidoreductase
MTTTFDVLVLGGGPAGSTAALLLARAGWSVAIVEKSAFPRRKVCGEFLSATNLPLLRELGLAESFLSVAGPEVRRVAIFAGNHTIASDMPRLDRNRYGWGHALGREQLDTMLLQQASANGATVLQPYAASGLRRSNDLFECELNGRDSRVVRARIAIAAHGSWDVGHLPTQPSRQIVRPSDLLGFKVRLLDTRLQPGMMPLITFPDGYGGMVHTDAGAVSLSCCIRRDRLERCRREYPGRAGEAVLAHVTRHCAGVRDALLHASVEPNSWRSAGPIRPGIRGTQRNAVFQVGNAAGEAHPVIAEGISMAMQSSWLLVQQLISPALAGDRLRPDLAANAYERAWRRAFAWRIRTAAIIAHWAMRPAAVAMTVPLVRAFPFVLTESARQTGKVTALCSPSC